MKFHPLAEALPILPGHQLDELADDIRENGLQVPVTKFEGMVLDGRNRYLACKKAKVKVRYEEFGDGDPVQFIVSHNLSRRHLDPSKRAAYILKLNAARDIWASRGRPKKGSRDPFIGDMAKAAGVSSATMKRARRVQKKDPKKFEQVAAGEITVSEAAREVDQNKNGAVDALGFPIPAPALLYWNRAQEVKTILKAISKLKSLADELHERKDPLYCEVNLNHARVEFGNMFTAFKLALPYVVCTHCQGELPDTCMLCKGRGVISEFRWKHALPQEARTMREKQLEKLSQADAA